MEELDLSGNNIKSIDFIKGMKAKRLEHLYLDDNKINDLSPLKIYNFQDVFENLTITLKNNNFDKTDARIIDIKNINNEFIKLEL